MRGNPKLRHEVRMKIGSIPAHAGEPTDVVLVVPAIGVYPRACGGTGIDPSRDGPRAGLSPRMRGNRCLGSVGPGCAGSIPAHAGEPGERDAALNVAGVYPRACGGTLLAIGVTVTITGLSPRMRGNRRAVCRDCRGLGSIPAHAGEPRAVPPYIWKPRVYPRACGGTDPAETEGWRHRGLSPRMRGNPSSTTTWSQPCRSIPAHAGEPLRIGVCGLI